MKALVIAPQPFFTPRGTPFSVYYRSLVTAELGVSVDLLTYGEGVDVDIDGVRIFRIPRFGIFGNVKTGPSSLKLFLDMFLIARTVGLLLRTRYDFVHAHEEAVFWCRLLKPIFRYKLVYDMHSSLPQQLTNFNFTTSPRLIGLFKWLEDGSLRAADAVITICPALYDYVVAEIPGKANHFLIENSLFDDVKLAHRQNGTPVLQGAVPAPEELIPRDAKVVLYAGTLEHYQGIDLLLECFGQVTASVPDAFLLIIGGTAEQVRHYSAQAQRLSLGSKVRFTGRLPQDSVKSLMKYATVVVSPRTEGNNTPLKVYELLASGIPMVATRILSHTQVLTDEVAFLVEPHPDDMARGVREALSSDAIRNEKVENARRLYTASYSREVYTRKMRDLLQALH